MSPVKILYLIRHGYFDSADPREPGEGKGLLPLGVLQAERTGERLARLGTSIDQVFCSDYTRARQTADIICSRLVGHVPQVDPALREIKLFCHRQGRSSVLARLSESERQAHPPTAVVAFYNHFASLPARSRREVLVCHGNLISYFLSRLLPLSPIQWQDLFIHYCSITEIHIASSGESEVVSICDEEHLPRELQL
jgi:serine/threonine-protein phosphatase PGAM5